MSVFTQRYFVCNAAWSQLGNISPLWSWTSFSKKGVSLQRLCSSFVSNEHKAATVTTTQKEMGKGISVDNCLEDGSIKILSTKDILSKRLGSHFSSINYSDATSNQNDHGNLEQVHEEGINNIVIKRVVPSALSNTEKLMHGKTEQEPKKNFIDCTQRRVFRVKSKERQNKAFVTSKEASSQISKVTSTLHDSHLNSNSESVEEISMDTAASSVGCNSHSNTENYSKVEESASLSVENDTETRINPLGIQLISKNLYRQIFQYSTENCPQSSDPSDEEKEVIRFQQAKAHLKQQKLWGKTNTRNKNVRLELPELLGTNLNEHFNIIGEEQAKPYKELLKRLTHNQLPKVPDEFLFTEGWTKYNSDGSSMSVAAPDCDALVFDVEVCVPNGDQPTLATAVSDKHWYSWCSKHLINVEPTQQSSINTDINDSVIPSGSGFLLDELIPLGKADPKDNGSVSNSVPRIIVGHNVSYDRIRIREQYYIPYNSMRFLDTMSLHIAVSGLVQEQRAMFLKKSTSETKLILPWMTVGSLNNLNDVYKFYCKTEGLQKETRNIFVSGSLEDIRKDFQMLMAYCAKDVQATQEVLTNLLPLFYERLPNPVTFAGILEMGSSILPVNHNWNKYIESAERLYTEMQGALTEKLSQRAVEALQLINDEQYEKDPWMWDMDWKVSQKLRKNGQTTPNWYVKLCKRTGEREGTPEPENMSTSLRVVPKLLRLTWNGHPLHHEKDYGWGYLRPTHSSYENFALSFDDDDELADALEIENSSGESVKFPLKEFYLVSPKKKLDTNRETSDDQVEVEWEQLLYGSSSTPANKQRALKKVVSDNPEDNPIDVNIPGVEFIRLPHKNGPGNNVGNPLAKDFLQKIEDGTLSSHIWEVAELVLKTTKCIAYWRNARDRIMSQNVVWLDKEHLPQRTLQSEECCESGQYGCILPQVVVCGTVTRRAVERTWLTASNARVDRIGSELKSMVVAPPGYHFVGADVDSQELWIAALLGDAYFSGIHGCTAMSWMTLQGSKAEGTDLHSNTAATAQITRDQAKVINYGRIYGAGLRFLQTLLSQYNPSLLASEARARAENIMKATKGEKGWRLSDQGRKLVEEGLSMEDADVPRTRKQINMLIRKLYRIQHISYTFSELTQPPAVWTNGSESYTFNCLESIVRQDRPVTPVLAASIPKPLEPDYAANQYMTSRMNWAVQSSAVDYLHLMTVCMRWLAKKYDINMRFSISIHDEVRYLVASEDRHRAALALQITNLLTRALFADRVGMPDLPMAVAFFSSVDVDKVLRKDPESQCISPSNSQGLKQTYGVEDGIPLSIYQLLDIVKTLDPQATGS